MLASGHRCRMFAARAKKRFSRFVIRFCDFCDDLHHVAFASDLMQIALGKRDHLIGATNAGYVYAFFDAIFIKKRSARLLQRYLFIDYTASWMFFYYRKKLRKAAFSSFLRSILIHVTVKAPECENWPT